MNSIRLRRPARAIAILVLSLAPALTAAAFPAAGLAAPAEPVAPQLAFEPGGYDFGLRQVNAGNGQTTLALQNTGTEASQVESLEIVGAGSNAFWIGSSNCYGAMLQPGESCSVQVNFNPQETIPYIAQLRARTGGVSFAAELRGAGGRPIVGASQNPVDFGSATVGSSGVTGTVTLTNSGNMPAGFFIAVVSGGAVGSFHLIDEDCTGIQLDPSSSCQAEIRFQPQGSGIETARLSFFGEGEGGAQVVLSGIGVSPQVTLPAPSPRVTFRWGRPHRPADRRHGSAVVAGKVDCHAARGCHLVARPRVIVKAGGHERSGPRTTRLPSVRLEIEPNGSRSLSLPLTPAARRMLKASPTSLRLKLSWRADDQSGHSTSTAPIR